MKRRALFSLATGLALSAFPLEAAAFCRTTSALIPPGYDPTARGCITSGVTLAWPGMPVTYQVEQEASSQVSLAEATPIIDRSFAKWSAATCGTPDAGGEPPSLSFLNGGPTDAGYTPCDGGACTEAVAVAPHVIIFRDSAWPHNDPSNTLALTTVTYGVDSGHILAANMEINSHEHTISTAVPPPAGSFSLEAIVTHEAGHFVGLAHSPIDTAVMFAHYQPGATLLTTDDTAGVCEVYPPTSPSSKGCSCTTAGADHGPDHGTEWLGLLALGSAAAARLRRPVARMNRRRHVGVPGDSAR